MIPLSDAQVDRIYQRLQGENLSNSKLQDELLDHICCEVEARLDKGEVFEDALNKAWQLIAPNGVKEIEKEVQFFLNFKYQMRMKKAVLTNAYLAFSMVSMGALFKLMHWQGAHIIFILGLILGFITCCLSFVYYLKFNREWSVNARLLILTGVVSFSLLCIGSLFKFFHFPSAGVLFVSGAFLLNFLFIPMTLMRLFKSSKNKALSKDV